MIQLKVGLTEISFGEWLKRQRMGRGLTREQLAHQIGCATITLRKIESEERRPSAQIAKRLAEIFEISQNEQANFLKYARGDWKYAPGENTGEAPWRVSDKSPRTNLPVDVTTLVGREEELAQIHDYLMQAEMRLVTLVGPPGMGKTRLGIEAARQSLSDFPDGVFLVQLAELNDPSRIASTTRQALGYVENRKLSVEQQLIEGIGGKQMLIVLDNCEHMIQDVAEFASKLLSACSGLKILATSREALRVPGEWLYSVPVLGIPEEGMAVNMSDVAQFPALTLFVDRARAVRSDFVLSLDNLQTVVEICAYLDGLPLAIELIAAQIRFLSPQALLDRLNEKFVLSAEGARTAPARQISLSHTFNWSYDSLTPEEQKLFAGLSVFAGGFTLEAAENIFSGTVAKSVPGLVASLLDKSLLQRSSDASGEIRFSMLVAIRHFAQEQLRRSSEAERIWDGHLSYFLELAEQADKEIRGPQQLRWFDWLECENDNLRAALTWTLESKKADSGLRLAGALGHFWFVRGYIGEGIGWLERVLAQGEGAPKASQAKALRYLGSLLNSGENRILDRITNLLEKSLNLYQELKDVAGIAWVLNIWGLVAINEQDHVKGKQLLSESLILRHKIGDPWSIAQTLQNFTPVAIQENNYLGAKELTEETIAWFRKAGDQRGVARTLVDLAELERVAGNPSRTIALLKESLSQLVLFKDRRSIAEVLEELAALVGMQDSSQRAIRLFGAAEALRETIGMPLPPYAQNERAKYERSIDRARAELDELTFNKTWAEGRAMTMEQAIVYALEQNL